MLNIKIKKGLFELILNTLVEAYNNAFEPRERLSLVKQGTGKILETKTDGTFNTMNLFVYVYSDCDLDMLNQIGVFKGTKYAYNEENGIRCIYYSGLVYEDIFLSEIGIFHVKKELGSGIEKAWRHKGFKTKDYTATCSMIKAIPFEDVRKALKNAGKIGNYKPYKPYKATLEEINKVLELAPEYFGLTQEQDKIK